MDFVIATHNKKKLAEIARILEPLGISAGTVEGFGFASMEEPEENGLTFEENAKIKAQAACDYTGLPAIADDSGLCVDAIDGRPGIYSARYGGDECKCDADRYFRLLDELKDVPDEKRTARFASSICVVFPNGDSITVRGECKGSIGHEPKGEGGFGYDPVFMFKDGRSMAQLTAAEKDAVSHRGNSLRKLKIELEKYLGR